MTLVLRGLLTLVAVLAATLGLSPVVASGPWQGHLLLMLTVVCTVVLGLRLALRGQTERRPLLALGVPSLVGLLVAAVTVVVWFGGGASTAVTDDDALPSRLVGVVSDHLTQVGELFAALPRLVASGTPPIEPGRGIELALVGGATFVLLIAEMLVAGLGMSWGAVLGVLAMWATPLLLVHDVPAASFLVAAVACVAVGFVPHRPRPRPVLASRLTSAAVVAALVACAGLAGAHLVVGGQQPQPLSWLKVPGLQGLPFNLDTSIDVGRNLGAQSSAVAYRYQDAVTTHDLGGDMTGSPMDGSATDAVAADALSQTDLGPMRLYTLVDFDGRSWSPPSSADRSTVPADGVLTNMFASTVPRRSGMTRQVTIASLASTNLPLTVEPAAVDAEAVLAYDPVNDELSAGDDPPTSYTLELAPRDLTAKNLRAADSTTGDSAMPAEVLEPYRAVASTRHSADIAALAQQVTADAHTQYDRLVALQEYFRTTGDFTYSTTVAATVDGDPVWTFLTTKNGYCVQFATAMLEMARTLQIPSRMSVGFLPGHLGADDRYEVTGADAHTWPEFYFGGYGWVRFEPTPGEHTGSAPSWTTQDEEPSPDDDPSATTEPSPDATSTPTATETSPSTAPTASASPARRTAAPTTSTTTWLLVGLAVLVVLAGAATAVTARRRYLTVRDVEVAWGRVLRAARRAGLDDLETLTPRRTAEAIERRWHGSAHAQVAREALDLLVDVVERHRYDEEPSTVTSAELTSWTAAVVAALRQRQPSSSDDSTTVA